jgi:hypothetical protein
MGAKNIEEKSRNANLSFNRQFYSFQKMRRLCGIAVRQRFIHMLHLCPGSSNSPNRRTFGFKFLFLIRTVGSI